MSLSGQLVMVGKFVGEGFGFHGEVYEIIIFDGKKWKYKYFNWNKRRNQLKITKRGTELGQDEWSLDKMGC